MGVVIGIDARVQDLADEVLLLVRHAFLGQHDDNPMMRAAGRDLTGDWQPDGGRESQNGQQGANPGDHAKYEDPVHLALEKHAFALR